MEYAAKTDMGRRRANNEDSYLINCDKGFFVVADGMGGHNAGEVASFNACRIVENYLLSRDNIHENDVVEAVKKANRDVFVRACESESMRGMGTTIDVCLVKDEKLCVGHVGDSRVYIISENSIRKITKDHSVVGMLIDAGTISEEEAMVHPQRNIITRAVGTAAVVDVDLEETIIHTDEVVLMCTDGLTNMVSKRDIKNIVMGAESLSEAADKLVEKANENGGKDNITVILIKPFGQKLEDK
ncbi:MAG: Stp1/IreP family PP2C-type Ser/Thr phosphatase [Clostridia bacterium]